MIRKIRHYLSGPGLAPLLMKAVGGSAGLRIAGMGFGFLVGVQLARGLGAEGYGIYGLAMSIVAILTVPTEFELPQLLTREVAAAQLKGDWGQIHGIQSGVCVNVLVQWLGGSCLYGASRKPALFRHGEYFRSESP